MPKPARGVRMFLLSLIALSMFAPLACGGDASLSVSEYAEFCADGIAAASLIEPERIVWSDLEALASRSARALREINPPPELSEFHRASLKAFDFVAGAAREQPPDALANPLALGFEAIGVATRLRRSIDALTSDVRASLNAAQCL